MQQLEQPKGKIRLDVGDIRFSGEGEQIWLDEQIDKFIEALNAGRIQGSSKLAISTTDDEGKTDTASVGPLASYLKAKGADAVQNLRFLATAAWLSQRGEKELTTSSIAKTLKDNEQKRLSNPSDCLRQNVSRGFCERSGNTFFITPDGWRHLGEDRE